MGCFTQGYELLSGMTSARGRRHKALASFHARIQSSRSRKRGRSSNRILHKTRHHLQGSRDGDVKRSQGFDFTCLHSASAQLGQEYEDSRTRGRHSWFFGLSEVGKNSRGLTTPIVSAVKIRFSKPVQTAKRCLVRQRSQQLVNLTVRTRRF